MNLLLDIHIAIRAIVDDPRLSASARELILDPDAHMHGSIAGLWEIAIRHVLPRDVDPRPIHAIVTPRGCGEHTLDHVDRANRYSFIPAGAGNTASAAVSVRR